MYSETEDHGKQICFDFEGNDHDQEDDSIQSETLSDWEWSRPLENKDE